MTGDAVFMAQESWEDHLSRRPELAGLEMTVQLVVEQPHVVIRDATGHLFKYRYGHGVGKTAGHMLLVVERRHDQTSHRVPTAWFTRRLKRGVALHYRQP